jgi:sarcosine oxidase subunit beta
MLTLLTEGDKSLFQNSVNTMREVGVAFEHLTVDQIIQKFPAFDMSSFGPPKSPEDPEFGVTNGLALTGGILIHEAGYVSDPQLATHNLQRAAEAEGAVFRFSTKIVAVDRSGDRVTGVTTDTGEKIEAAIVVNAAGPHSMEINKLARVTGDMRVTTRPMFQRRQNLHRINTTALWLMVTLVSTCARMSETVC